MKKRIVVTGMGSVNPLGLSVDTSWQAALSGQSGISRLDQFDEVELRTKTKFFDKIFLRTGNPSYLWTKQEN